jgi:hypothetical protein
MVRSETPTTPPVERSALMVRSETPITPLSVTQREFLFAMLPCSSSSISSRNKGKLEKTKSESYLPSDGR